MDETNYGGSSMKASKKVMESVIVSGLALTLAVTAVTGNGVNIAAKDAADTQFVNNGIAGVASAMNEYELESADYLDSVLSPTSMRIIVTPCDLISIDDRPLDRCGTTIFWKMTVTDGCGNQTTERFEFVW